MKIVVVSDVHFGDPTSTLAAVVNNSPQLARGFGAFAEKASTGNDFLVLMGDLFDFSVANYAEVYRTAQVFFQEIRQRGIAQEVIFVPGNHDFSFWHIAMHEANVINQITKGGEPKRRWTMPGILDDREPDARKKFTLAGVTAKDPPGPRYGGLFLDSLAGHETPLTFNVAYPNLYVIEPGGATTLLTHGHYFETYWSIALHAAQRVLVDAPGISQMGTPKIEDIVAVNFPLNELASAGIGQAGKLTDAIREIQRNAKDGQLVKIRQYLQRARNWADELVTFHGFIVGALREYVSDKTLDGVRDTILKAIEEAKDHPTVRGDAEFLGRAETRANVDAYLDACVLELGALKASYNIDVPFPKSLTFGHTHRAVLLDDPSASTTLCRAAGEMVTFHNTGGWLSTRPGTIGGAVFTYDSGRQPRWQSAGV